MRIRRAGLPHAPPCRAHRNHPSEQERLDPRPDGAASSLSRPARLSTPTGRFEFLVTVSSNCSFEPVEPSDRLPACRIAANATSPSEMPPALTRKVAHPPQQRLAMRGVSRNALNGSLRPAASAASRSTARTTIWVNSSVDRFQPLHDAERSRSGDAGGGAAWCADQG